MIFGGAINSKTDGGGAGDGLATDFLAGVFLATDFVAGVSPAFLFSYARLLYSARLAFFSASVIGVFFTVGVGAGDGDGITRVSTVFLATDFVYFGDGDLGASAIDADTDAAASLALRFS